MSTLCITGEMGDRGSRGPTVRGPKGQAGPPGLPGEPLHLLCNNTYLLMSSFQSH